MTTLTPDYDKILEHLQYMFGGYKDGYFELAYTPADNGKPQFAKHFKVEDIEKAADFIVDKNELPGINFYLKPAVIDFPADANNKRTGKAEYGRCSKLWADIDRETKEGELKSLYKHHPPALAIITGRTPFTRVQLYWDLYEAETDIKALELRLRGIQQELRGDKAVVDGGTLMRVGGSVAWPKKPGRVAELTDVITPEVIRKPMLIDSFETTYPTKEITPGIVDDGKPRSAITGRLHIEKLLEATRTAGQWHDNMRDAVAAMVSAGWDNAQIRLACGAYCTGGAQDPDLMPLIDGARSKFEVPEPDIKPASVLKTDKKRAEETEKLKDEFNIRDWSTETAFKGEAKPVHWLVEDIFPVGVPVLLASMGGLGKSFLALQLALEVSAPVRNASISMFGGKIRERGGVAFLTAEDNYDSVHRRLNAIDPKESRSDRHDRLFIIPMPELGGPAPLVKDSSKGLETTPFFDVLKEQLLSIEDLKLIIIDPMQAFVSADITASPETGQFVWSALANLAAETGATVIVTHHMRKDGAFDIKTPTDAREAIRGSTALVDGARLVYALWPLDEKRGKVVAKELDEEYATNKAVQGAVCKSNDAANFTVTTFWREESGILSDIGYIDLESSTHATMNGQQCREALEEMRRRYNDGQPFSPAQNSDRSLLKWLMSTYGIDRSAAKRQIENWVCPPGVGSESLVEISTYVNEYRKERQCYKVKRIP